MGYIKFDKTQLINLEYSLKREILRSNRAGSYAYTTLVGCNTRKYHGLLACPIEQLDGGTHMLLSSLDETVIQHNSSFNLALHRYQGGVYEPKGHKYIRDFDLEPNLSFVYRVGGVVLKKELILVTTEERMMIRYTLLDAHSPTKIRFKPFLAFRNIHSLSKANMDVNRKYTEVENGIKIKLYNGYPNLYMQFSKKVEYVHVPDWYYNVEYLEEKERGYDYLEDLFVPGYFEMPIRKGEVIVFSAGTQPAVTRSLNRQFDKEIKSRVERVNFENCLLNAAQQFIVFKEKRTEIIAGFPWFGAWGRDTFISLPGLTLSQGKLDVFRDVINTMIREMKGPFFPNAGIGDYACYNSVDAPLWFFWSLQQYCEFARCYKMAWKEYGKVIKKILNGFREGTEFNIKMHENGLLWQGKPGYALTWMDAVVEGKPITPRIGFAVEINALWYNAIMFSLNLAKIAQDRKFLIEWIEVADQIKKSFVETFYNAEKGYLADVVTYEGKDWSVRPNQVFATSLPFSPIDDPQIKRNILEVIQRELLTPKGLRTLSPNHPDYKGIYGGNQAERDVAYHQGTVWPWLLGAFAEGMFRIHGKSALSLIERLYQGFEEDMVVHGIGTISEIYDGDPPHHPNGAVSQAWSVAELLRIKMMIDQFND
ncbi:MAG TPA: amylo-alpha-1,6-glucosidase [Bacteroidales bacterium]|mgnify:CR=1 FL=1|jgi:predicted glycogen debranching enzyme|nr:amylo-alpha-1,6-glucosidase [Bacteroidales bacterium]HOU97555.1 amylo-alpha-1,6-glucosidase [Bacteroidales bacterium]